MSSLHLIVSSYASTIPITVIIRKRVALRGDAKPLEPGQLAEVPAYLARILVQNGYAELADSELIDLESLRNILYLETRAQATLEAELAPNFYQRAKLSMATLRGEEYREYASTLMELARIRLRKLVATIINAPNTIDSLSGKLAAEEYIIGKLIAELVRWFEASLLAH